MRSNHGLPPRTGAKAPGPTGSAGAVLTLLSVSAVSYALVQSMVNPALADLRQQLHTTQLGVSWVLTAFLLSSAVLTPILGRIGDQAGKRGTLVAVLLLLAVGSVVAALATSLPVLVAGRVLQGAGGATLPLAFGIIRDLFPGERVGSTVGVVAATSAVGGAVGVLVAGPIITHLSTAWLFWLPAAANGVMAFAVLLFLPDTGARAEGRLNWRAGLMLAATLVLLLLPLSLGQEWGWGSPKTLGSFAGAVAAGAVWVAVETRSRFPLIDMRVFRLRPVWTANLASFLFGVTLYSSFGFIPSFLQTPASTGYGLGESVTVSGLLFLPVSIVQFSTGLAAGPLARRMPTKKLLAVSSVPIVVSFVMLALLHGSAWLVALGTAVGGLGFGIGLSALSAVVVHAVPAEHTGAVAGMNANIRTIGGAVGAAVVATVLSAGAGSDGLPSEGGYTAAFLLLAATAVVGLVASLLITTGHPGVIGPRAGSGRAPEPAPIPVPAQVSGSVDETVGS